jgi:glycosyltransferase involved in cell wall biosynthesis
MGPSEVDLTVVVPAFNEASTIAAALHRLDAALALQPLRHEVIVISDGSTDGTGDVARSLAMPGLQVVEYPRNRGKGGAIHAGADLARGRLVAFIDADLDIDPSGIAELVDQLESSGVDAVIASKIHPDSVVQYPTFRRFQSSTLRLLVRTLFSLDIADSQTGLKVFRGEVLRHCLPLVSSTGFAFDIELLVIANDAGYRIAEGPVRLDYQFTTTADAGSVVQMLRDIARIWRRRRRSRSSGGRSSGAGR